jgi:hypothetical protein
MSNIDFAPSRPNLNPSASSRGRLSGLALRMVRWVSLAQQQHSDWIRLQNMDDYMLKDMGLQRDQIDDLLGGSATQRWRSTRRVGY